MINLYLGRDEEIITLRDGASAPADTPITLRQLVLAMDEECAVAAEHGGIDAHSIEQFDEWLLADPAHLDQVLPEAKGVVVLVPRWTEKNYGDPWVNMIMAEENRRSYWLLRNGSRLYRMATAFHVGKTLVPKRDEFLSFFFEERYNHTTGQMERVPLEVGSRAYMQAEERAEARNRHFMRVALILQGLLDRTPIFHPLPEPIQITRPDPFERGLVRIVNDAELALSDGHERYRDWLARINGALEVGMRIFGDFHSWEGGFRQMREKGYTHPRLHPPRDDGPGSNTLYRLEGKRNGGFYFLYERREYGYGGYERRASCVVEPTDRFILAFDAATAEEMEYYLRSRLDRREYVTMFPLLKAAIRMKREEATQEEPFRQLLTGQIALRYDVDIETAAAEVPELIRWWKFKTKTHRALVGDDDGKALQMIVDEFGVRQRERANRAARERRGEFGTVRDLVLARHPDALLIAHKAGPEYVALAPANEEPVYVTEIVLTSAGERERREWRIVDNRHQRWGIFYTSDRWPTWRINASPSDHPTDPEIGALGRELQARMARYFADRRERDVGEGVLLAITFDHEDNAFHIYWLHESAAVPPADQALSGTLKQAQLECRQYGWQRDARRAAVLAERSTCADRLEWPENGAPPWHAGQYRRSSSWGRSMHQRAEMVIFEEAPAVAQLRRDHDAYIAAVRLRRELANQVGRYTNALRLQWEAAWQQRSYEAFLVEYGDPELWEGHRKTLRRPEYPYFRNSLIERMIGYFIERGEIVDGLTFGELTAGYHARVGEDGWMAEDERLRPTDIDELVLTTETEPVRAR